MKIWWYCIVLGSLFYSTQCKKHSNIDNACEVVQFKFDSHTSKKFAGSVQCDRNTPFLCQWFGKMLQPNFIECIATIPDGHTQHDNGTVLQDMHSIGEMMRRIELKQWMHRGWRCTADVGYIFNPELQCKDVDCPIMASQCIAVYNVTPTLVTVSVFGCFALMLLVLVLLCYFIAGEPQKIFYILHNQENSATPLGMEEGSSENKNTTQKRKNRNRPSVVEALTENNDTWREVRKTR